MGRKKKYKVNKGKLKNLLKRKQLFANSGSATAETILIIAVMLVIVITVFYPQIRSVITDTFASIAHWYFNTLNSMGVV